MKAVSLLRSNRLIRASAALGAALFLTVGVLGVASAQTPASTTYKGTLSPVPLNGANSASGTFQLVLSGTQATITEQVSGLASSFNNAPYPHVQHIHGGAAGACPTAAADANSDKVLSTTEGGPAYGAIQTTLSTSGDTTPAAGTNIGIAPTGASFSYSRTITLDAATISSLTSGKAVVVVHGLDPATAAPAATSSPSELVPSLPLAATSPALCGVLVAQAQAATPSGTAAAAPSVPKTGNGGLAGSSAGVTSWAITLIVAAVAGTALVARKVTGSQR